MVKKGYKERPYNVRVAVDMLNTLLPTLDIRSYRRRAGRGWVWFLKLNGTGVTHAQMHTALDRVGDLSVSSGSWSTTSDGYFLDVTIRVGS